MRRLAIAWGLVLAFAASALAQSTGSSFGGGDWGSSGASDYGSSDYGSSDYGSSDYGSSYGGSSDYGSSSSDYGSSDGGSASSDGSFGGAIVGLLFIFGIMAILYIPEQWRTWRSKGPASRGWSKVDVTAMRLAIDWRARAKVQRKLDALARTGATSSKRGLVRLLRETVDTLSSARLSWLYAGVSNYRPMSQAMAQGIFAQLTVDARARFHRELVRNADGAVHLEDAGALRAHPHEGGGVVVVTLVVAARCVTTVYAPLCMTEECAATVYAPHRMTEERSAAVYAGPRATEAGGAARSARILPQRSSPALSGRPSECASSGRRGAQRCAMELVRRARRDQWVSMACTNSGRTSLARDTRWPSASWRT